MPSTHVKLVGTDCPTTYVAPDAGEAIEALGEAGATSSAFWRKSNVVISSPPAISSCPPDSIVATAPSLDSRARWQPTPAEP
jgi:hypothetical protein